LGIPTGDVLIVAYWRLSTPTQYLTWFGKPPTSMGEVNIIRERKREQHRYMEEEDHIHSTLLLLLSHTLLHKAAGLLPLAATYLFLSRVSL
jgi:hypothetical protein